MARAYSRMPVLHPHLVSRNWHSSVKLVEGLDVVMLRFISLILEIEG